MSRFKRHNPENRQKGNDVEANCDEKLDNISEYAALDSFITTSRDSDRKSTDDKESPSQELPKRRWYQFWKSSATSKQENKNTGVPPDLWLETDIRSGIQSGDVEGRRKQFGWNELTAEKENMVIKFLRYFTGPIVYGA
jgi:H+-transporting ATPase